MQGESKERWMQLAEKAATEQDPVRMLELITEINDLLAKKQEKLIKSRLGLRPDKP